MSKKLDEPRHYVFADLEKQGGALDPMFRYMLSSAELTKKYRLSGMWTKGIMSKVTQLQASDIVAYEINKRAANLMGEGKKFIRRLLQNMNLYKNFAPLYFGAVEINRWIMIDKL